MWIRFYLMVGVGSINQADEVRRSCDFLHWHVFQRSVGCQRAVVDRSKYIHIYIHKKNEKKRWREKVEYKKPAGRRYFIEKCFPHGTPELRAWKASENVERMSGLEEVTAVVG